MSKLIRFGDGSFQCWSRVDLDNGEPIFISVARSGILIKRSNLGIMGKVLFNENLDTSAAVCALLDSEIHQYNTPEGMANSVLRLFTQLALESESAADLLSRLRKALYAASLVPGHGLRAG